VGNGFGPFGATSSLDFVPAIILTQITVGSLIIKYTKTPASPFYVAFGGHILTLGYMLFLVPESLTPAVRAKNIAVQQEQLLMKATSEAGMRWYNSGRIFAFLSPLALFWPRVLEGGKGRNWNLTLVCIAYTLVNFNTVRRFRSAHQRDGSEGD
jgi:hypothetical protein